MNYLKFVQNMIYFKYLKKQTRAAIEEIRLNSLRNMVKYAYENSLFYRELYRKHGIGKEDIPHLTLKDLPYTNKKMLMENFNQVVTDQRLNLEDIQNKLEEHKKERVQFFDKYEIMHTSGTSGLVGIYPLEIDNLAIIVACINTFIYSPIPYLIKHGKRCKFINCVVVGPRAGTVLSSYASNKLLAEKYLLSIMDPMDQNLEFVNKINPDVLTGYASAMKNFAAQQLAGKINITPEAIVCSGDATDAHTRDLIKQAFGVNPIDYYSCTENLFVGFKRDDDHFSIMDTMCYIGDRSMTNLYNKVFPIIKYQTDDIIDYIEDYSKSPFTKIKLHTERSNCYLKFVNNKGQVINLNTCLLASFHVKNVNAFQFSKLDGNTLCIKVEGSESGLEQKVKNAVTELLKIEDSDRSIHLQVEMLEKIPTDPNTGKFRLIMS